MKKPLHHHVLSLVCVFALSFLIPAHSFAQTFFGVSSNPADNATQIAATVVVTPPASMVAGDLVIIYAHYRAAGATLSMSATGGQAWTNETTANGGNQTFDVFWCRFNGTWGANPSVTGGNGTNPFSAIMYVYRPYNASNTWGIHVGASNNSATNTTISITGLTTTVPNTVTMAFWGSPAANTWGTLTGTGWSKTGLANQYRNIGGSDQSHTAAYNIRTTTGAVATASQTQSTSQSTRTNIMCWREIPPALTNNECAGATLLTSGPTCTNTTGNIYGATNSAPTITAPSCAGTTINDVWYRFVAQTTNPTITLSSLSAGFTNPGIQLLSDNCGSTFTSLFCGTTSIAADFLIPGTSYYIRVYSTSASITSGASFNICITDPVATVPPNDECANAINLLISASCSNIPGTVSGATPSALGTFGCSGTVAYDVWYKFTALTTSSTITLSGAGSNFNTPRLQLLSGACGSLTSLSCSSSGTITYATVSGTTYYVRVYSATGPASNGNSDFNICVAATGALVRYGNSYVNITRKTTGGVVQTGDILEIRMTINHTSGTMSRLRYVDNVPTKTTMATSAPHDSIKIITNEGLRYKKYTLAAGDDAGTYLASPPAGQYNVRLNLGFGATLPGTPVNNTYTEFASATGSMNAASNNPRGGGGMLFAVAYRVRVTGLPGDTIVLNPARFVYYNGTSDVILTGTSFKIVISNPLNLCSNSIGLNVADEFGGTFGSGTSPNRLTDLTIPISGYSFISNVNANNNVGDGRYAIVKNLSPRNRTVTTARRQPNCNVGPALNVNDALNCNNRMFNGYWYIDGDHTGTNNAAGNAPPASNANAGYMLMVNADYVASEIYRQNITNLCPNTYYEFSAWVKNICPTCGIDSTGAQFAGTPTAPANGYPGVYPNLTFALNDVDYYNSGEVDTLGWLKKGFVFRTGPTQTNATFSIRNNSQGGGGNDWALDDIAVATCLPTMAYSPTINPNVCTGNSITIADTISSFFRNYTTYKWQRSTNGGSNWTDVTGVTTLADTNYYVTTFTVPPGNTTLADSGDLYRVVVATTTDNLSDPNCNISDGVTITLSVNNCGIPLQTDLLSFNGKLVLDKGNLSWTTSKEDKPVTFIIERSNDGISFTPIGSVSSHNNYTAAVNSYSFIDPVPVTGKVYYRLAITDQSARKYSRVINLIRQGGDSFGLATLVNPFNSSVEFDITAKNDAKIEVELIDLLGKVVRKNSFTVYAGVNALSLPDTGNLPSGTYIFRVRNNEMLINRKVLKNSF